MFLPPKLKTIVFGSLIAVTMVTGLSEFTLGQQAEFDRRMAAMQEARSRAVSPTRVATADIGVDYATPPAPVRTAQLPVQRSNRNSGTQNQVRTAPTQMRRVSAQQSPQTQRVVTRQRNMVARTSQSAQYVPQHMSNSGSVRTAQLMEGTIIDSGSPIVNSGSVIESSMGCSSCGTSDIGGHMIDGGCSSCGDAGAYFDDSCCDRGGCPPGPCWLDGLGAILYNAEYFGGATSFQSALFPTPGGTAGQLSNDCSHGFYGGFNVGIPLCKLTCGVFSGQVGVRSVQSNFNGASFTPEGRDQLFVTAGIYRRVDYGLQIGAVADILYDNWFTDATVVQVRGDIGWVYPSGSTLGFRLAQNVQDDVTNGTFAGNNFTNLISASNDNYRFYYRHEAPMGGYGEAYFGWTDQDLEQTIVGLDFDIPVTDRVGVQAGFTYFLNDENANANSNVLGGNIGEAYNIFVGFAFRPRGRSHYKSYDRPLFSVADNGSMLITRTGGQ
ncbi:MAG: DUF6666 family protein [Mariniblastus sp.]